MRLSCSRDAQLQLVSSIVRSKTNNTSQRINFWRYACTWILYSSNSDFWICAISCDEKGKGVAFTCPPPWKVCSFYISPKWMDQAAISLVGLGPLLCFALLEGSLLNTTTENKYVASDANLLVLAAQMWLVNWSKSKVASNFWGNTMFLVHVY